MRDVIGNPGIIAPQQLSHDLDRVERSARPMASRDNLRTAAVLLAVVVLLGPACGQKPVPDQEASTATAAAVAPTPTVAHQCAGIDVSHYSGAIDWAAVRKAGYSFAVLKATEGMTVVDPYFERYWEEATAAGLVCGAYHFYVTEDDPAAQARHYLQSIKLGPGNLVPVVDIELIGHGTHVGLASRLQHWLRLVEAEYGVQPIIYTSPKFWDQHLDDSFGSYPLWIAEYDVEQPSIPIGWQSWHLWQWYGDAEVPGVEKEADLTRINCPELALSSLLIPQRNPS